ncbi:MAG: RNA methyltransferase [Acidobacteriota bacterium]|nr:RNA methyltransferase [Acidobacteriota bacterium]
MDRKQHLAAFLEQYITERRRDLFDRVLASRTRYLTLVVEDPASAGDASAVMRSCEIFGIQDLHLIARKNRFEVSKGVAVGSSKWVTTRIHGRGEGDPDATAECVHVLRAKGYRLAALCAGKDGIAIDKLPLDRPLAVCLAGGEVGLSKELHQAADLHTHIPAAGFTQTFNISVCAALVSASLTNRLHASQNPWRLTEEETLNLRLEWLAKMPKRLGQLLERYREDNNLAPDFPATIDAGEEFRKLCRKHGF